MGNKAVSLPEGVKIQVELKMGQLPKSVKSIDRLELFGDLRVGIPGLVAPVKGGFGKKGVPAKPLVLENIPIDRQDQ